MAQRLAAGPEGLPAWGTADDALLRHRDDVHNVVRRVLADAGLAEDVVQETLERGMRHEGTVERERAGAWLTVVGRRLAIDVTRARQRFEVVAEHDDLAAPDDPADVAEQRQLLARLAEAMDQLSPRQRRLLLRQVDTGLSLAQLAEEERTTVASVRSVLARAREALRANLHDSGWLVAGLLPRLVTAARGSAERLLARIERLPFVPQGRHDLAEVFTAGAAAVALLLSAFAGDEAARGDARDGAQAPTVAEAALPADPQALAFSEQASPLDVALPALSLEEDLGVSGWWVMPPEREHVEIPFQDFGGDVTQFAVAPDQRTIFATGGWVETTDEHAPVKQWAPLFYRSDDAGQTWARYEVPGFVPGRVLFSPRWPADPRVFVVTEDKSVLQSNDGGRTFLEQVQQVGAAPTPAPPPVDHNNLGGTLTWAEAQAPDPSQEPKTVIREQQHAPRTPPIRPAVISRDGERIAIGGQDAGVFHVVPGVFEPFVSTPPWQESHGVALAPDDLEGHAVFVGAVAHGVDSSTARGAVYRCEDHRCHEVRRFDDMGNAPGVFTSRTDRDLVYAFTPYTAYRSADGGLTWTRQVLGPVLDLVEVDGRLVFVSMSGVPASDDRGVTWRQLSMVYSMWAAAAVGDRHLVMASGPGMACSPDRGNHWLPRCPPP